MIDRNKDQSIRLSPFEVDGTPMIDIRYWRNTAKGPRPTKKFIVMEEKLIPQMIIALQRVFQQQNAERARETSGVQG